MRSGEGCEGVEFCDWRTCDLQDLLRRAAFLVTDYSSVAMDFAYMQKPLLYYQFDLDEFRANQYKAGYFDFVRDGFGPVCTTEGEAAAALASWAERGRNEDASTLPGAAASSSSTTSATASATTRRSVIGGNHEH